MVSKRIRQLICKLIGHKWHIYMDLARPVVAVFICKRCAYYEQEFQRDNVIVTCHEHSGIMIEKERKI